MKFPILLLLGLCALISAQGDNQIDIPDMCASRGYVFESIQKNVEQYIKKLIKDTELVVEEAKELALEVQKHVINFGEDTRRMLETVKADMVTKVDEIKQKGVPFEKCAQPIVPEFEAIEKEASSDMRTCAKLVIDEYKKIEKNFIKDRENIAALVSQFYEEVKSCCIVGFPKFFKCSRDKIALLKFNKLFKSFKDSILETGSIAGKTCERSAAEKASARISDLRKSL